MNKTGTIKFIEPANPPTWENKYGLMHSYMVTFADGNKYKFNAKGDFKRKIGETISFTVQNEQTKNAKLNNDDYIPKMSKPSGGGNTNDWILLQVCFKEVMQAFGKDYEHLVLKKTEEYFDGLKEIYSRKEG